MSAKQEVIKSLNIVEKTLYQNQKKSEKHKKYLLNQLKEHQTTIVIVVLPIIFITAWASRKNINAENIRRSSRYLVLTILTKAQYRLLAKLITKAFS